jgi:glycosyltransferase involved in cell wall biosynthesis
VNLPEQREVTENWSTSSNNPLVTIVCIAYNHAEFIDDAFHGFLWQNTDFPFEILVHDDASTDGTQEKIRWYAHHYPELVCPVLQGVNQYSANNKPVRIATDKAAGKYIAICEADDYWTDPQKLKKQVAFLERNPDYVVSGHDVSVVDEKGRILAGSRIASRKKKDYSQQELIQGKARLLTLTWVYRASADEFPVEWERVKNGDVFRMSLFGLHGKGKFHHDVKPGMYRVHSGGVWSTTDLSIRREDSANTRFWLYRYYHRTGYTKYSQYYRSRWLERTVKQASLTQLVREVVLRCFQVRRVERWFLKFNRWRWF